MRQIVGSKDGVVVCTQHCNTEERADAADIDTRVEMLKVQYTYVGTAVLSIIACQSMPIAPYRQSSQTFGHRTRPMFRQLVALAHMASLKQTG